MSENTNTTKGEGQGTPSTPKQENRPRTSPGDVIDKLRADLATARSISQRLTEEQRRRSLNSPIIELKEDSLRLYYSTEIDQEIYSDEQPLAKGKVVKDLYHAIEPLVRIVNALLQGEDLRKLKPAHVRDAEGRPTNVTMKMPNGDPLLLTNSVQDLQYFIKKLSESPAVITAAEALSDAISKLHMGEVPGVTTKALHKNSYELPEKLSEEFDEHRPYMGR